MSSARSETVSRVVDPVAVAALADLLGSDVDTSPGAPLPALWHWVALSRWPATDTLGPDGHPRRGTGVVPEIDLPRRMFGGGRLTTHAPVPVGAEVTVTTSAGEPREREGRSGFLVLLDLTVEVRSVDDSPLLTEVQHLVYAGPRPPLPSPPEPVVAGQATRLLDGSTLRTDPGLLARFSALTANPHRIHTDWPYATREEGYPGLVVHGPLLALVLGEALRRAGSSGAMLEHRGTAPLFCGEPAEISLDDRSATVHSSAGTHATLRLGDQ
ncbi:hypothetical protein ABFT23_08460 [Nocardioides sp. C4-1]|uniref:FAS1-like dehydratase domain-containing protein n=1 Tax=Nocardioides sp. C4-1 TaxID=3151851 RepID=UPI003264445B